MGTNITGIGNANAIGFKSRVTGGIYFPPELKDALVGVWSAYGKSNDSTDRNIIKNKIKDRGGDFVISNAAFKLNSGFGGFVEDFTSWDRIDSSTAEISNDGSKIKCINTTLNVQYLFNYINRDISSFKVKISNFTKGDITYYYRKEDGIEAFFKITPLSVVNSDKVIELPKSYNTVENGTGSRGGFYSSNINIGVTIEQIPSFEGAFVTDGVNDLITSTKTVQEMGVTDEITIVSMIHQIQLNPSSSITNDIRVSSNNTSGSNGRIVVSAKNKTGIYGWSRKGNTKVIITKILGDKNDYSLAGENSTNYNNKFSVVGTVDNRYNSSVAWYWTIIANKVLTTDQINQVIAYFNLDKYVKPDIYYNVKKQGLTNDTPDEDWYLKDFSGNGRDMTLYNYARTPESGINEEGGLQSDGVVDYGQFVGDLGLKDYTVVIDRAYNNLINNQVPLISSNIVEDRTPFIVKHWNTGSNAISFSYGASRTTDIPLDINKKIVYQSTYSYMGYVIPKGNAISTGNGITLGKFGNGAQYSAICLWSLMLFPYSMSEFLIERQLKKYKLGTLYPDMVEFRQIVKSNSEYQVVDCYIDTLPAVVGNYYPINSKLRIAVTTKGAADEVTSLTVNGVSLGTPSVNGNRFTFNGTLSDKSPQKINITIDEYIRYEDIVQPYPSIINLVSIDKTHLYTYGDKLKVGDVILYNSYKNLLKGLYSLNGQLKYNGVYIYNIDGLITVAKEMVFSWTVSPTWLLDNNEPKVILSPSRLRMPNSSYKLLGYIPDISGHGNHGVIHNSAYAEGSGVNEDGSYQFDGVDDFITIPTTVGGKQVLMKVNWNTPNASILYDQRGYNNEFAIYNGTNDSDGNPVPAYQGRNNGQTYIDGILNSNIKASELRAITHNITITNELSSGANKPYPIIGSSKSNAYFVNMALYDFMLFDEISTDDKIEELNKYVGIEAKVELPPYYWDAYGKTNLDADKATIQQRGVAVGDYDLTNYNHAYNKMSGYGGYKFAKFDNTIEWFAEDSSMVVNRNGYLITLKKVPNVAFWRFRNTTLKKFR